MSRSRAINSIARIILPAALFLFTLSSHAQDAGAAAAQATQQANQAAAQAAQQANDQMMRDAQQVNQQAMQNAQQAAMNSPATPQPHGYGRADKPKFYPSSGKFTGATSVTIKDSAPKASIFYTLDGTEPTTSSAPYTGPVLVGSTAKLKAIARSPIYTPSKVATATYVIK